MIGARKNLNVLKTGYSHPGRPEGFKNRFLGGQQDRQSFMRFFVFLDIGDFFAVKEGFEATAVQPVKRFGRLKFHEIHP